MRKIVLGALLLALFVPAVTQAASVSQATLLFLKICAANSRVLI